MLLEKQTVIEDIIIRLDILMYLFLKSCSTLLMSFSHV